jgi:uncharacterized membrane protein YccC
MRKQQIAIIILALWLTIVSIFMLLYQQFDFEIFFVLGFIGILVIVTIIEPNYVQPTYLKYIWYVIAVGILIFGAIIAHKVMQLFIR